VSTLWTPDGEHPVGRPGDAGAAPPPREDDTFAGAPPGAAGGGDPDAMAEQMAAMRAELADSPAEVVIANHCYGLFELAALYLSHQPARLVQARLAIDALGSLIDGLSGRLGEAEPHLKDGLSQLRLAYVQIEGATRAGADVASGAGANGGASGTGDTPGGVGSSEPPDAGG
jgi:hypothetical protein